MRTKKSGTAAEGHQPTLFGGRPEAAPLLGWCASQIRDQGRPSVISFLALRSEVEYVY